MLLFSDGINRLISFLELKHSGIPSINPLKTKGRLLHLKIQFVPRSRHFSSRLQKTVSLCCKWHKSLFVLR